MSDDLVKRLRGPQSAEVDYATRNEGADRIEDLERQRAVWQEHFDHMAMQIAKLERQRDEACTELKVIRSVFDTAGEIPRSAYFAEARNAALEEAATFLENMDDYHAPYFAADIRALKDKQP
jgi:hypothetical protein